MYLTPTDYLTACNEQDKQVLTENSNFFLLENMEQSAAELIKSYLKAYRDGEYDLDVIFQKLYLYDVAIGYNAGACVFNEITLPDNSIWNEVYYAKVTNTGSALNDTAFWEKIDKRPKLIIRGMVDLVMYDLYTRIMPDNIPTIRKERYEYFMEWLKGISSGKVNADLPLLPATPQDNNSVTGFYTIGKSQNWHY